MCGMVTLIHSLTLSSDKTVHLLHHLRMPSMVPCMIVLYRLSCRTTWPNHVTFHRMTMTGRGSLRPMRLSTLFNTYSLVPCSKYKMRCSFRMHFTSNAQIRFYVFATNAHVMHTDSTTENTTEIQIVCTWHRLSK